jgi:flagellar biosynthetic protein FliR
MNEHILNNMDIISQYIPNFLFILLRVSIFLSFLPVLGGNQTPIQFRIGLAVFISLLMTPVVDFKIAENHIPMMIVKEIFMGMALGMTVRFIFLAVNMAGVFISQTVGMSIATAFNPEMGQSTQIAELYGTLALLYFLVMDVHHDLIFVFVKSFELLPAGQVNVQALIPKMLSMGSRLFVLALKISSPIVVGALITYLLSGFLYKAAPQLNIFFIVMPLNIFLGFMLMILSIPVFEYVLGIQFSNVRDEMVRLISMAKG